jgi:hypothetical protein
MGEAPSWDFFAAMSVNAYTLFTCYDASRAGRQLPVALNLGINRLLSRGLRFKISLLYLLL